MIEKLFCLIISQPFISTETGELVFAILRSVIVKDKLRMVLGGNFKVDFFDSYLENMKINGEGYGTYLDNKNNMRIAYAPIELTDWSIAITVNSNKVLLQLDIIKLLPWLTLFLKTLLE